jgi:hypothetical protein
MHLKPVLYHRDAMHFVMTCNFPDTWYVRTTEHLKLKK